MFVFTLYLSDLLEQLSLKHNANADLLIYFFICDKRENFRTA